MKESESSDKKEFIAKKHDEYERFIALVESGVPVTSWTNVAEALGVSKDTITDWKKTERYKIANQAIIQTVIQRMTEVGQMDWRMWDRYAKLLGVDAVDKTDITSNGKEIKPILGGQTNDVSSDDSNKETTPTN